jgi:hypothetical protein
MTIKRKLAFLPALLGGICLFFCACSGGQSTGTAPVAPPDYQDYPSLARFIGNMEQSTFYWEISLPGMDRVTHYVEITDDIRREAVRILTENHFELGGDIANDDSRDTDIDTGYMNVQIYQSDDGVYPNGNQLSFVSFLLLGEKDPARPNTLCLFVNNENYEWDAYLYDASVFDQLNTLFSAQKKELRAELQGEYIRLRQRGLDDDGLRGDALECGETLLLTHYFQAYTPASQCVLEGFDLRSGEEKYRLEFSRSDERGELLRIAALSDIPDYDYCIFFEKGVAYRSSEDPEKEVYFPLPAAVQPVDIANRGRPVTYDMYNDSIAWTGEDGISFMLTAQDSVTEKQILANQNAENIMNDPEGIAGPLFFTNPRFLCKGTRLAVEVYSAGAQETVGVVICNPATGAVVSTLRVIPPAMPNYPVTDRYIATRGISSATQLLDAQTGEVTAIPAMRIARSFDYETFIVSDYITLDAWNAPEYICTRDNPDDRSRLLLRASSPYAMVSLSAVTEHYALFHIRDYDGSWYAAARYAA